MEKYKYCFKVFSRENGEQVAQIVTTGDCILDTLKALSELGNVKGFLLDDKENNNDISDL